MDLNRQIISTLAYYDVFGQPLTVFEIWKYLIKNKSDKAGFEEVFGCLEKGGFLKDKTGNSRGFYFLKGRENIVAKRLERQKIAIVKMNIIKKYGFIFSVCPFLKSAFISGSLAQETSNENSDIDFMLIAKNNRIWTCRFFLVLSARLFRKYRHGKFIKDRFCFNHFITDKTLEIKNQSLYNAQTYAHFYELGDKNILKDFYEANRWMGDYLANFSADNLCHSKINLKLAYFWHFCKKIKEFVLSGFIGDIFEAIAKKIQIYFIERNPLTKNNFEKNLIKYSDLSLEFHPDSAEEIIAEKYKKRLNELLNQK